MSTTKMRMKLRTERVSKIKMWMRMSTTKMRMKLKTEKVSIIWKKVEEYLRLFETYGGI